MYNNEIHHHGVLGMKWGVRRYQIKDGSLTPKGRKRYGDNIPPESTAKKKVKKAYKTASNTIKAKTTDFAKSKTASELSSRGKSAIDVLMNGDTDWMGNKVSDESLTKEARNRGKAALERMLYSQDQIDNKKFFGRYNF